MSLSFAVMIIVTMTATLPFGVIPRSLETRWDARSCQIGVYFGLSGPEPYGDQRGAFLDNSRSGGEPAVNVRQFAFLVLVVGAVGGLAVLGWRLIQNEQVDIRHSGSQAAVDCREIPLLKLRVRGIKCLSPTRRTSRRAQQRAAKVRRSRRQACERRTPRPRRSDLTIRPRTKRQSGVPVIPPKSCPI